MSDDDEKSKTRSKLFELLGHVASLKKELTESDSVESNRLVDRLASRLDYFTILVHDIISRSTATIKTPAFYPATGTVFVMPHAETQGKPCLVEGKEQLSVAGTGWVCFFDREEGMGDYPRWLEDVKTGVLKVLWCPNMGPVKCNEDYLTYWGLF